MAGLSVSEHCWATAGTVHMGYSVMILCADDAGAGSSQSLEPLALVLTSGTPPSFPLLASTDHHTESNGRGLK